MLGAYISCALAGAWAEHCELLKSPAAFKLYIKVHASEVLAESSRSE